MIPIIDRKKPFRGFTIVEVVVAITVISIITTVTTLAYTAVQKQSRDSQRTADVTTVVEGLERYYAENGEYPSVAKLTNTNATTVQQLLKLNNLDGLIASNATPGSTTNIWKTGNASPTNKLTYTGRNDQSASCLTNTNPTDVCDDFKIQYYKEDTGTVETILSRNTATAPPAAPVTPTIAGPAAPTLTVALVGANVEATRTGSTCNTGAQTLYSFRTRTNDGTWSSYSAWDGNVDKKSVVASQGVKHGFQVKAKCLEGDYSSAEVASSEATYVHPITTPAAPVLTIAVAANGDSATWSWNAVSCPSSTTAQYDTQFFRDDASSWRAYDGTVQTTTSVVYTTNYEGYEHRARAKARCTSAYDTSDWSPDSNSPAYIHPVTAPGNVTNYRWSTYNGAPTITWDEPTCGLGTRLDRRYWAHLEGRQYFADGSSTTTGSSYIIFNSTRPDGTNTGQWRNMSPVLASQYDMTYINVRPWVIASTQLNAYLVHAGAPNTNSQDTEATKGAVQLRCINPVTGRLADGNITFSGWFTR